ncbi:hypothetical protein [Streptomyces sp. NBC_01233]|uniref:hypothetical protein n=1 Tax=Streptomyces sp. NBC_01233 TaxID=2903787 RepID=UPI002E148F3F|nr:hypothetical protein OG332_24255 [Streptomyces sp. NBC_01233]
MSTHPDTITTAIARGCAGDRTAGLLMIQPLISESARHMVSTLSVLAEVTTMPYRDEHPDADFFGLSVTDAETGDERSAEELPAHVRFAAQFVVAHASGDYRQSYALFDAFAERCIREENDDLGAATAAMYDMAVASTLHMARHGRRPR